MNQSLRSFLERHCIAHPTARMPLAEFVRAFRDSQPASVQQTWTRGRVAAELTKAGFVIGRDAKVFYIGGLSLRGSWKEVNGALVMEPTNART